MLYGRLCTPLTDLLEKYKHEPSSSTLINLSNSNSGTGTPGAANANASNGPSTANTQSNSSRSKSSSSTTVIASLPKQLSEGLQALIPIAPMYGLNIGGGATRRRASTQHEHDQNAAAMSISSVTPGTSSVKSLGGTLTDSTVFDDPAAQLDQGQSIVSCVCIADVLTCFSLYRVHWRGSKCTRGYIMIECTYVFVSTSTACLPQCLR